MSVRESLVEALRMIDCSQHEKARTKIGKALIELQTMERELAEAKARAVIPDGWVAVPEIPTIEMLIASEGWREYDIPDHYPDAVRPVYGGYLAMLAARPEFPPNGLPSKEPSNVG